MKEIQEIGRLHKPSVQGLEPEPEPEPKRREELLKWGKEGKKEVTYFPTTSILFLPLPNS